MQSFYRLHQLVLVLVLLSPSPSSALLAYSPSANAFQNKTVHYIPSCSFTFLVAPDQGKSSSRSPSFFSFLAFSVCILTYKRKICIQRNWGILKLHSEMQSVRFFRNAALRSSTQYLPPYLIHHMMVLGTHVAILKFCWPGYCV